MLITAESYEEAVALVKSWQGEHVLCFEDNERVIITDGETLYETSEHLSIEENGGKPTIEVLQLTERTSLTTNPITLN